MMPRTQALPYSMMKTVLVTGGAGFIGNHLCEELLSQGYRVVAFDNLSLGNERNIARLRSNENFSFIMGDILNEKQLQELFEQNVFDTVFHFAANSDIARSNQSPDTDFKNTFLTTHAVLEQMRKHGVKKIVFASTGAIWGDTAEAVSEDTGPLNPISHYGAAKLASEAYLSAYSHNYEMQVWIVRFPNVVGEYATHGAIYDFIRKLKAEPSELEVLGNGEQIKPYLYVKEVVDAIFFVWKHAGEMLNIFNIGVDSRTKVKEIAQMVIEQMNVPATIRYTGGIRGWVGDVAVFTYNFEKIKQLGWQPKLSSNQAVELAIERILIEQNSN